MTVPEDHKARPSSDAPARPVGSARPVDPARPADLAHPADLARPAEPPRAVVPAHQAGSALPPEGASARKGRWLARWQFEPAVALALLVAWLTVHFVIQWRTPGITTDSGTLALMFFLCGAIALVRVAPELSLAVSAVGGFVAFTGSGRVLIADGFGAYVALILIAVGIALRAGTVVRWLTFIACIAAGPWLVLYLVTTHGGTTLADDRGAAASSLFHGSQQADLPSLLALIFSAGLVVSWGAGVALGSRYRSVVSASPDAGTSGGAAQGATVVPGTAGASRAAGALRSGPRWDWLMRAPGPLWTARVRDETRIEGVAAEVDFDSPAVIRPLSPRMLMMDTIIAAALLAVSLVSSTGPVSIIPSVILAAALGCRRVSPLIAIALAWVGAIVQITTGPVDYTADIAVLGVLYAMAAYGNRTVRRIGLISALLGAVVAGVYLALSNTAHLIEVTGGSTRLVIQMAAFIVGLFVLLGFAWVLGLLARTRRIARASARARLISEFDRQRAQERVVIEQQRTRIARDMHDVVAHSLAVVIAQADGARYAHVAEPDIVGETLKTISATARSALSDVRQLLAELRDGDSGGPQPGAADLARLYEQLRAAGLRLEAVSAGTPAELSPGNQIALYRITQEALTNALRHGDTGETVTVRCQWEDDGVELTVVNRIRPAARPARGGASAERSPDGDRRDGARREARDAGPGGAAQNEGEGTTEHIGHGLPGMRERAVLAGGVFQASAADGSFTVRAFLPRASSEPAEPQA